MVAITVDRRSLRELIKGAVAEILEERKDFLRGIIEEAIEETAMARAIGEGMRTKKVSRKKIARLLIP